MIELNLLPKELRKRRKKRKTVEKKEKAPKEQKPMAVRSYDIKIPSIPISIILIALLVAAHVLLVYFTANNNKELVLLQKEWDGFGTQRLEAESVAKEIKSLEDKLVSIRKIARPDLDWTQLLNGLNDSVIPNVWLSTFQVVFKVERGKNRESIKIPDSLRLSGFALGKSEEATSLVARFINSLRRNKDFSGSFEEIELQNMQGIEIDEEEAMRFNLNCKLRKMEKVTIDESKNKTARKRRRRR